GTAIAYATDLTLTQEQKDAAIAVIFYIGTECDDEEDEGRVRMLGIGLEDESPLAFATEASSLNACRIYPASDTYYNGTNCIDKIKALILEQGEEDDTSTEENYPALYWAKNYKSSLLANTEFADGWYMPTYREHEKIASSNQIVEAVYSLCGKTRTTDRLWCCDQIGWEYATNALVFPIARIAVTNSTNYGVCAIREF
nr:hypothetical protein [Treponemataceae bacterium]